MDPALVKAAYNVACPQPNGNTLITLCCANDVGQSVDQFTMVRNLCFSSHIIGHRDVKNFPNGMKLGRIVA